MMPYGGEGVFGAADNAIPHDELLEQVLDRENMRKAWKRVKANKGAAGVDGMSISEATGFIRQHWEAICSTLGNGRYKPKIRAVAAATIRTELRWLGSLIGGPSLLEIPDHEHVVVHDRVQDRVPEIIGTP